MEKSRIVRNESEAASLRNLWNALNHPGLPNFPAVAAKILGRMLVDPLAASNQSRPFCAGQLYQCFPEPPLTTGHGLARNCMAVSEVCDQNAKIKFVGGHVPVSISDLVEESLNHRAVRHPYLQAIGANEFADIDWVIRDFAENYYGYSANFPRYLTAVISKLESPQHRASLLQNLTEESGVYDEAEYAELAAVGIEREWIEGMPHPQLFRRFREATGLVAPYTPQDDAIELVCWRESFLSTLNYGSAAEALGALGLGTENIVSTIYQPFVKALSKTSLAPRDTVFFPLHTAVDDHHQEALEDISRSYAATPSGKGDLRKGMIKALSLRSAYWDWLYDRALTNEQRAEAA